MPGDRMHHVLKRTLNVHWPCSWEWILQEIRNFPSAYGLSRAVVKVIGVISTVTRLWSMTIRVWSWKWMVWMSWVEPRPIRCQETSGLFWHNFRPEKRKTGNDDDGWWLWSFLSYLRKSFEMSRGAKLTITELSCGFPHLKSFIWRTDVKEIILRSL